MFKFIFLAALVACVVADASVDDLTADVLDEMADIRPDGFTRRLGTSNGIFEEASGDATGAITGSYEYMTPEGIKVSVSYVADENGYQPVSDFLPTPPPVPDYIMRAIEYIKTHPSKDV